MKKNIVLFTLGGTIAYTGQSQSLSGKDLLKAVPGLDPHINIIVKPFLQKASSSLTINDVIALARDINKEMESRTVDGIVVTQGTDTLEESAFILDMLLPRDIPIVVTGAMRNPMQAGADGPANLLAAIHVAKSSKARGIGTVVVFNDEIHSPLFVRKTHTQNVAAFRSEFGRLGWISEGEPRIIMKPNERYPVKLALDSIEDDKTSVALVTVSMDDDDRMLRHVNNAGYQALVLEGLGGGHVPAVMSEMLISLSKEIPVILTSRTGGGQILTDTYKGYSGSETYLLENGLISAGWLDSRKARILIHLLLKTGNSYDQIRNAFNYFQR